MTQRSDMDLLKAFLGGDNESFDLIVQRYSTSVYRLAYKFTRNRANAEDVAQDTFLRCYEYLKRNPKEVNLKPWLMTICVNLCRNLAKKKKNFNFSDLKKEEDETHWEDRIEAKDKSPADKARQKNEAERVNEAIEALPEKYQIVIQLRYADDLSYQEIADVLDLPLNTVKVHLTRAKEKLKAELS